jgi:hypothetical protein
MKKTLIGLAILAGSASLPVIPAALAEAETSAASKLLQSGFVRIENRWRPGQFINVENGLTSGPAPRGWHSADWAIEDLGDGHVRIGNRFREGQYLHVENGRLEAGGIQAGWHSAQWIVERADGFVRFRNRWNGQYIHVENGRLEAGAAQPGWHSAMWSLRRGG